MNECRRPVFRICVLYVDEDISVQRQLARGKMIREHNLEVKKTGQGVFWEERVTDNDESVNIIYNLLCFIIGWNQELNRLG